MIDEMINSIIEAEKKADIIVKDSQQKAKEMILDAKNKAVVIVDDSKKAVKHNMDEVSVNANYVAERQRKQMIEDTNKSIEKLAEKAKKKEEIAIEKIVGGLIEKYGNS